MVWSKTDGGTGLGVVTDDPYQGQHASVFGNLFVLTGGLYEEDRPAIWTSRDGLQWDLASVEGADQGGSIDDVSAGPTGSVAVGWLHGQDDHLLWWSPDAKIWTIVHDTGLPPSGAHSVASIGDSFVALASDSVFLSPDGRNWTESTSPQAADVAAARKLFAWRGELTAFSEDQYRNVTVWRSPDGESWAQVAELPESANSTIRAADAGSKGWSVIGLQGDVDEGSVAWFSADGINFTKAEARHLPPLPTDVLADDLGFVAVGYEQRGLGCALDPADIVGVTSVSEEGLAWSQMPRVGWAHQQIDELLRDRRLLIGVGLDYRVPGQRDLPVGSVWTAPLPEIPPGPPADAPPTPGPPPAGCN